LFKDKIRIASARGKAARWAGEGLQSEICWWAAVRSFLFSLKTPQQLRCKADRKKQQLRSFSLE
jgi:hypothetical protein